MGLLYLSLREGLYLEIDQDFIFLPRFHEPVCHVAQWGGNSSEGKIGYLATGSLLV